MVTGLPSSIPEIATTMFAGCEVSAALSTKPKEGVTEFITGAVVSTVRFCNTFPEVFAPTVAVAAKLITPGVTGVAKV